MRPTVYKPRYIEPRQEWVDWNVYEVEMGHLRQVMLMEGIFPAITRVNLEIQNCEVRANVCKDDDVRRGLNRRISTLYFEGMELLDA